MRFKVSHFPQVPCDPFEVEVKSIREGALLMNTLSNYDAFLYEKKIRPDYSSALIFEIYNEDDKEWESWDIEVGDGDYFEDPRDYIEYIDSLDIRTLEGDFD